MEELKICKNCKHYNPHYYRESCNLKETYSGGCIGYRVRRLVAEKKTCDRWAPDFNKRKDRNERFKNILLQASKRIIDIAEILKEIGRAHV